MLVYQPMAIRIDASLGRMLQLYSDTPFPQFAMRMVHQDLHTQMNLGGTQLVVEFESTSDIVKAAATGLQLADEIFSALAICSRLIVQQCVFVDVVEVTPGITERRAMCQITSGSFANPSAMTMNDIGCSQRLIRHWRDLDSGKRLRRAARSYAQALGEVDPLFAFQFAYMGLEALEKPLALEAQLKPGTETMKGQCAKCGAEFERNRTALVGARAFVRGDLHKDEPSPERVAEWKAMSNLRSQLTHGLDDSDALRMKAVDLLPAAMHNLHDAIVHLSHSHDLESERYSLARIATHRFLLMAEYEGDPPDDPFEQIVRADVARWIPHPEFGMVPEVTVNTTRTGIRVAAVHLQGSLSISSEDDLEAWRIDAPNE